MTAFDAIYWETLPDGRIQLRPNPLPVATKTDVRAGVAHLDGVGDVAVPSASDVRAGVAVDHTVGTLEPGGGSDLIDIAFDVSLSIGSVVVTTQEVFAGSVQVMSAIGGAFADVAMLSGPGSSAISLSTGVYYLRLSNGAGFSESVRVVVPADAETDAFETARWKQRIAARPFVVNYFMSDGSGGYQAAYGLTCHVATSSRHEDGQNMAISDADAIVYFLAETLAEIGIVPSRGDSIEIVDTESRYGVAMALLKHHGAVWKLTCESRVAIGGRVGKGPF